MKIDQHSLATGSVPGVFLGFAADAWLGNWDVVGKHYDNIQVGRWAGCHDQGFEVLDGGSVFLFWGAPLLDWDCAH